MNKTQIECDYCRKSTLKSNKDIKYAQKHSYRLYCNSICANKGKSTKVNLECANCHKVVERTQSQLKRSKQGRVFCTRSCATTYNNSHYKTGLNNPNWKDSPNDYRSHALKHYPNECAICSYNTVQILEVHHKDKDRSNNDLSNLIVLCPTHHNEIHFGIRQLV